MNLSVLHFRRVEDIPVDGSVSAREIIRCCEEIEAWCDTCLRQRSDGGGA